MPGVFFNSSEMHIIDALTINFIVAGFIVLCWGGRRVGKEKENSQYKMWLYYQQRKKLQQKYQQLQYADNIWSFYPMTFKFCAIVNNTTLSSRASKRCA